MISLPTQSLKNSDLKCFSLIKYPTHENKIITVFFMALQVCPESSTIALLIAENRPRISSSSINLLEEGNGHPTLVLWPGKSHGRRSLVGCSPWGSEVRTQLSDFTFTFHFHALEKEMAIHSSILAWRTPGTVEPGGLPSMGSHRVRHN